ncbi:MAG TPA: peptide deformylase [Anaerolineae bacterium]|nr:peptide deformylase [Anaerolineae bacterium]HOR00404.1 peptide deformylase [Anaerolineae bacterium]HPL28478.1 peptide deformylase [Anaerolineae bacterium]
MPVRTIVTAEAPVLRQKAKRIKQFSQSLQALIDDMFETLHAANGVGLAAPQVGVSLRAVVIEIPADDETGTPAQSYVLCNPEIVKSSGEDTDDEGCLSLPGYVGEVTRAAVVTVKGFSPEGKPVRVKGEGLLARALQHELDHLDGVLFIDRLESLEKLRRVGEAEEEAPGS